MSIFDIFTFKKDVCLVFSRENIKAVLELTREAILNQAEASLAGYAKKSIVDVTVSNAISTMALRSNNKLVHWMAEKLIETVPTITQLVYDFLKEKVEKL